MPPAYLRISIARERASGTTNEAHAIGISGGTVGGVVDRTGPSPQHSTSRFETRWVDDTLVFATSVFEGPEPRTGDWSERPEMWSLASPGRLRIEIVAEARDRPSETSVFLYRRQ